MKDDEYINRVYEKYNKIKYSKRNEFYNNYHYKNNKANTFSIIKSIILVIIISGVTFIGGFSVYAAVRGKIDGIPVIEWLEIKFSNKYNDYKEEISNQKITYNKTTVELMSTVTSDYVTIFEFDVKLSDKDKEYLKLGESIYTEKDKEDLMNEFKEDAKIQLINEKGKATEEDISKLAKEMYENDIIGHERIEEYKKYINTIELGFNKERKGEEFDSLLDMPSTKDNIYIDGKKKWCRNYETVEKISDNEYKVYHIFLLTEDDLNGKTNFNITLKNNIIANTAKLKEGEEAKNDNIHLVNTANNERRIKIDGEFSVNVSKDKILKDSKIIKCKNKKSIYKNVTQKIERININPLQTIIKTKTTIKGVDSNKRYYYNDEKQNPLCMEFRITDSNGNKLSSESFETKKTLIRSNGKKEQWEPGDIKDLSTYRNGTFELIEYIIVENCDTDKIIIYPYYEETEEYTGKTKEHKLDKIELDLN